MALKNVNVTDQTYSSDGREFHSLGAATWNALSLRVTLVLKEGASSKTAQEECKLFAPCDFAWTRSWTSSVWVFNTEPYTDPPFGDPVFAEPRGITSPCVTYAATKAAKMSQSAKTSIFPAMSSLRVPDALIRLDVSHAILLRGGHSEMMKQKDWCCWSNRECFSICYHNKV